jgi:hypothetical protein
MIKQICHDVELNELIAYIQGDEHTEGTIMLPYKYWVDHETHLVVVTYIPSRSPKPRKE